MRKYNPAPIVAIGLSALFFVGLMGLVVTVIDGLNAEWDADRARLCSTQQDPFEIWPTIEPADVFYLPWPRYDVFLRAEDWNGLHYSMREFVGQVYATCQDDYRRSMIRFRDLHTGRVWATYTPGFGYSGLE